MEVELGNYKANWVFRHFCWDEVASHSSTADLPGAHLIQHTQMLSLGLISERELVLLVSGDTILPELGLSWIVLLEVFQRKHSWVPEGLNLQWFQCGFYFLFFKRSIFHFVGLKRMQEVMGYKSGNCKICIRFAEEYHCFERSHFRTSHEPERFPTAPSGQS